MKKKETNILRILAITLLTAAFFIFNPGTYVLLFMVYMIWNVFGIIGKLMVIFLALYFFTALHILFTEEPEEIRRIYKLDKYENSHRTRVFPMMWFPFK